MMGTWCQQKRTISNGGKVNLAQISPGQVSFMHQLQCHRCRATLTSDKGDLLLK